MFIHSSTAADATAAATIVHSSSPALLLLFVRVTAAAAVVVFAFLILVRDALVWDHFVVLAFALLLVLHGRRRCCCCCYRGNIVFYRIFFLSLYVSFRSFSCSCSSPFDRIYPSVSLSCHTRSFPLSLRVVPILFVVFFFVLLIRVFQPKIRLRLG